MSNANESELQNSSETYRTKLFEWDLSILVLVGEDDRFVYNLLELSVFKVVSDHHFQHLEQFSVRYEAVVIHVIDSKGDWQSR